MGIGRKEIKERKNILALVLISFYFSFRLVEMKENIRQG